MVRLKPTWIQMMVFMFLRLACLHQWVGLWSKAFGGNAWRTYEAIHWNIISLFGQDPCSWFDSLRSVRHTPSVELRYCDQPTSTGSRKRLSLQYRDQAFTCPIVWLEMEMRIQLPIFQKKWTLIEGTCIALLLVVSHCLFRRFIPKPTTSYFNSNDFLLRQLHVVGGEAFLPFVQILGYDRGSMPSLTHSGLWVVVWEKPCALRFANSVFLLLPFL